MDVRKKSQKQEARTAKQFGGKVVPGSGCIDGMKGDTRTDKYLIENKYTTSSYTLKKSTWEKIRKEALRDGIREPLMQIDFVISELETHSFILMDLRLYEEMFTDMIAFGFVRVKSSISIKYSDITDIKKYLTTFVGDFRWDLDFHDFCLVMIDLNTFLKKVG